MTSQLDITNIYTRTKMKRIVTIPASELTTKFDENLLLKLRNEVEGKCNKEGYIEKGSVKIINHGTLDTTVIRYKGDVSIPVEFTGKVVNPVIGEVIECQVRRFNDFGLMAAAGPLNIVVPFGNKKSTGFNVGQKLKVKVIKSDIILNDNHIDVYATFYDEKETLNKAKKPVDDDLMNQVTDEEDAEELESGDELTDNFEEDEDADNVDSESNFENEESESEGNSEDNSEDDSDDVSEEDEDEDEVEEPGDDEKE